MPDNEKTKKPKRRRAFTHTTTYHDPKDGFVRTALCVGQGAPGGSVDVVTPHGGEMMRLAQLNIFVGADWTLMIDVIDVDRLYKTRHAITFDKAGAGGGGSLPVPASGNLVGVAFEREAATAARYDDVLEQKRLLSAALKAIADGDGRGAAEATALRKIARAALGSIS